MNDTRRNTRDYGGRGKLAFANYEAFVERVNAEAPKTTDDCYTPADVYDAVVDYVATFYDLSDSCIVRPFFPGGDYRNVVYNPADVVIDNPPFSIFGEIIEFYTKRGIPFFLFGPGLTIMHATRLCTVVVCDAAITYENGAKVRTNYATNMLGDVLIRTAPELNQAIIACESQQSHKKNLPKYEYPDEFINISSLQVMCHGGQHFEIRRGEAVYITRLDALHAQGKGLFGNALLVGGGNSQEEARGARGCLTCAACAACAAE